MPWRLTVRVNGRVERVKLDGADEALAVLEDRARAIAAFSRRDEVTVAKRTYTAVGQVQARLELRGPDGASGGVDVRGDGSTEAYTGRFRRQVVEPASGEDDYAALRRALLGSGSTSAAP